jgi:type IV secretion system protein VirB9
MMKKSMRMKLIILGLFVALHSYADTTPLKLSSDSRIEVVAYSPFNVVPIEGTVLTATQITFGRDEFIETVQCGDLGAWTASVNKDLPYMLFVKPTVYGSQTNMTVITNKHTYYFELQSGLEKNSSQIQATYALHFIYPLPPQANIEKQTRFEGQQQSAELSAFKHPSSYNWDYSFHGDKAIVPLHVFDDGKFTYMQLQPGQPVPAVFAVMAPNANESVVNVRKQGNVLVVQQVAPEFTLRAGTNQVANIFNHNLIAKYRS